jgi:hypothetical protein
MARRPYYTPVDELLGRLRVRVLRAMVHFDWCAYPELIDALDLTDDRHERDAFSTTLRRLVRDGSLERQRRTTIDTWLDGGYSYRITSRGRDRLRRLLATSARALEVRP